MRTVGTAVVLVASLAVLTFASSVAAQAVDDTVVASVPFQFVAGDEILPAGTYRVRILPDDTSWEGIVVLQRAPNDDAREDMIFQTVRTSTVKVDQAGRMEKPQLTFEKVGDHYFLDSITTG